MAHALATRPRAGETPAPGSQWLCCECRAPLASVQPGALFCSPVHRTAYQQRMRVRGRQLAPYAMADRLTRSGTAGPEADRETGKTARAVTQRLIAKWAAEDKAAGRVSAVDYVRRLAKNHDVPL